MLSFFQAIYPGYGISVIFIFFKQLNDLFQVLRFHLLLPDKRSLDFFQAEFYSCYNTGQSHASAGGFKWLYRREALTLEKTERLAARLFGRTLVVSEFEAETFRKIAPESAARIGSLTNGVDVTYFAAGKFDNPFSDTECPIVMTGHMDYRPNYEGALWFAKEILPLVKKSVPNARAYFAADVNSSGRDSGFATSATDRIR